MVFRDFDDCAHRDCFACGYVWVVGETHTHAECSVVVDVFIYRYVWWEMETVCF